MFSLRSRALLHLGGLLVAMATLACSSADAPPPAQAAPAAQPTTAAGRPTFHFIVDRGGAKVEVSSIFYADRFVTRLDNLPPGGEVSVRAHLYQPGTKNKGYTSSATFVADAAGVVDTGTTAPVKGTYTDVDPDGLMWSMMPEPLAEGLGEDRAAAFFDASIDGVEIATAALARTFVGDAVEAIEVADDGLVGVYYFPRGAKGKVPIVAFGGSEGGLSGGESTAMRLSALGHPTLGLAYFGEPGVPRELSEIPLEYFAAAFAWLERRVETAKGKVVVMGGSRGGELALQLGSTFPSVVGVIANMPSSHRWAGLSVSQGAAWTFEGEPLDYVPSANAEPQTVQGPNGRKAYVLRDVFAASMAAAKPADLEKARIRVEDTRGSILMLGGSDDALWPACDFMTKAMEKLRTTGHADKYADESICFPDAGHDILSLGLPTTQSMWSNIGSSVYALGGSAKANARAGREGDEKIQSFLSRVAR